ncbi:hypothetical protein HDZ31DRAFT_36488, partial [Schizophyllum fasciatum]
LQNERNRSVTLQKRKAGLLKKAYELGVLCTVDIAVIIFEERPNHRVKLYQYASSNIDRIVQRQTKYRGETDTLGPADFGGAEYVQEDDEDEDEAPEDPRPTKRARRVGGHRDDPDDGEDIREKSARGDDSKHNPPSFDFLRALAGDPAYSNMPSFHPSLGLPSGITPAQYASLAHQASLARQASMLPHAPMPNHSGHPSLSPHLSLSAHTSLPPHLSISPQASAYRTGPSRGATHPTSSERGGVPNISDRALLNAERLALAAERERLAALSGDRERLSALSSDRERLAALARLPDRAHHPDRDRFQIPSPVSRPGTAGPDLDWALLAARAGGGAGSGGSSGLGGSGGGSGSGGGGGGSGLGGGGSGGAGLSGFTSLPSLPFGVGGFDDAFDARGGSGGGGVGGSDGGVSGGARDGGGGGDFKPGLGSFDWPGNRKSTEREREGDGKDEWLSFLAGGSWPVKQEVP